MGFLHFDEAGSAAEKSLREWLIDNPEVAKALLIRDLFGKFRLAIWSVDDERLATIKERLLDACGPWWSMEAIDVARTNEFERTLYEEIIANVQPMIGEPRLFCLNRHRSRTSWFVDEKVPLWPASKAQSPIIVFYSFKGGLGRSTSLASFAIQRARAGERVCVFDIDLDSPGIGRLLASDESGLAAQWGVVDFLLDQSAGDAPLSDYYHRCDRVAGDGEIVVFPSGRLDEAYADKLARLDFDETQGDGSFGLSNLLTRARDELRPNWILLDARTGITEQSGRLLSGFAHHHVLLGSNQDQSWLGLNRVLDRLGKLRVIRGMPQSEVTMVHAMVPHGEAGKLAQASFAARSEKEFTERYYVEAGADVDDGDAIWSIRDIDSHDAPHVAIPVDYDGRLADFRDISDIADLLLSGPHALIGERILSRFVEEVDN